MRSLSSVGLGLSLVFGCLLLALIAEVYYLLWWKKRITNSKLEDGYSSPAREFLYMFCWKKPSSLSSTGLTPQEICSSERVIDTQVHEPQSQLQIQANKEMWLKPFGEDSMEAELFRLQNLSGPPRFLFTIKEETKEDLESEDGKSRKGSRSRSLGDLVLSVETPFLTPVASPSFFTPPRTPTDSSYSQNGFNPLFESSTDAEFNRIKSSPPPKFKFLRDAEDKLQRKLKEVAEVDCIEVPSTSDFLKADENKSFITLIVAKNEESNVPHYPSSSSQVLSLAASPQTFRPLSNKKSISL
ncbi:hypothetical protein RJ639_031866 [Escallonia herrerae]|uniref:Uncharacterized protein n=1 Tax=Escallonia herrerae TaxID=1293975 RepID=A0AA88X968_9ASTE|nr:hypothetical protein RJ639_031866 [Escallonia herrerae]